MQVIENNEFLSELSHEESAEMNGGGLFTAAANDGIAANAFVPFIIRFPALLTEMSNRNNV
jgi:hypothetical protein